MVKKTEVVTETKPKIAFETLNVKQTEEALSTNGETGLTSEEAKARLEKYGPNKLEEKKKKSWCAATHIIQGGRTLVKGKTLFCRRHSSKGRRIFAKSPLLS